jgi:hypothetical protein
MALKAADQKSESFAKDVLSENVMLLEKTRGVGGEQG